MENTSLAANGTSNLHLKMKPQRKKDFFSIIPRTTISLLSSLALALFAATMRGDWIMILVHINKQFSPTPDARGLSADLPGDRNSSAFNASWADALDRELSVFDGVLLYVAGSLVVSFLSFYGLGGYLQYVYYIKRRNKPEEWKCQPEKFLSAENERHEILMGSLNMVIGGTVSGMVACYVVNGGQHAMYFSLLERGWFYLVTSTLFFFLVQDALAYYLHKAMHWPYLYKKFHKWHHRYHQPTAFSATAMHPVEFFTLQSAIVVPIFFLPIYSGSFICILLYNYYYGMIDHSGIKMDALWPWQPESMFHDDHHKYFHVNFGFNLKVWDWMHDTLRKENRIYGEDVFGGKGKTKVKPE